MCNSNIYSTFVEKLLITQKVNFMERALALLKKIEKSTMVFLDDKLIKNRYGDVEVDIDYLCNLNDYNVDIKFYHEKEGILILERKEKSVIRMVCEAYIVFVENGQTIKDRFGKPTLLCFDYNLLFKYKVKEWNEIHKILILEKK